MKEVFYLNPVIFEFKDKKKLNKILLKSFSYDLSNCEGSQYLREAHINHSIYQNDEELHQKLITWANGIGTLMEKRVLRYELNWQAIGLPLNCFIL